MTSACCFLEEWCQNLVSVWKVAQELEHDAFFYSLELDTPFVTEKKEIIFNKSERIHFW